MLMPTLSAVTAPWATEHKRRIPQAAINYAHKRGKLTHTVAVELPAAPPPKERWLTRDEGRHTHSSIAQGS